MKITKKVLDKLTKCYCIANVTYNNEPHIVVAAEKQDQCYITIITLKEKLLYGMVQVGL